MPLEYSSYIAIALAETGTTTPLNMVIAGLAFLNTLGIFGLIYHVGTYVGRNDQRWEATEKRLSTLDSHLSMLQSQEVTQAKIETMVASLKAAFEESRVEVRNEIQLLRRRSHDLSNALQRIAFEQGRAPLVLPEGEEP